MGIGNEQYSDTFFKSKISVSRKISTPSFAYVLEPARYNANNPTFRS